MTITFPRPLPTVLKASEFTLTPSWQVSQHMSRGGIMQAVEHANPYWKLSITTPPRTPAAMKEIEAWLASLRGGQKTFTYYRAGLHWPSNYANEATVLGLLRANSTAFNGTTTIDSLTGSTVTVGASSPLPANLQFKAGDLIDATRVGTTITARSLHMVVEDATANASGVVTLSIEPIMPTTIFQAGNTVRVVKAVGEFILTPDTADTGYAVQNRGASFSAISVIRSPD